MPATWLRHPGLAGRAQQPCLLAARTLRGSIRTPWAVQGKPAAGVPRRFAGRRRTIASRIDVFGYRPKKSIVGEIEPAHGPRATSTVSAGWGLGPGEGAPRSTGTRRPNFERWSSSDAYVGVIRPSRAWRRSRVPAWRFPPPRWARCRTLALAPTPTTTPTST